MNGTIEFLLTYGYAALFACVLAEQLGLPLPAAPFLLAAGALAGIGKLNLALALLLAVTASLIGDTVWYYLGKTRGMTVLQLLCRISLEPDACVRQTNAAYSRHGSLWLLFAKFIPGVSTVAPPMAGIYRVKLWRFVAMDGGGACLWAGTFLFAGWWFSGQIDTIAANADLLGMWMGLALAAIAVIYVLFKWVKRAQVYRSLRVARITPLELKQRMELGEPVTIVDLRNAFEWSEGRIPGSIMLTATELDAFLPESPEAEMILYCSCPNEVSSAAAAARRLKRRGIKSIRPLQGGFPLWMQLGFPVELPVGLSTAKASAASSQKLVLAGAAVFALLLGPISKANAADGPSDYRILATSRTSTMEKELNEAALSGYRFQKVMGGKTANGGQEVVVAMIKDHNTPNQPTPRYKLLATTRTSTMQKELQRWADAGFEYLDQTVFQTALGGKEVVVILERTGLQPSSKSVYRLLATSKISTMEKELNEAGREGFLLVGFTIGKTEIGGEEIISILRKN